MDETDPGTAAPLSGLDLQQRIYKLAYETATILPPSRFVREAREDVLLATIATVLPEITSFHRLTLWNALIARRLIERFGPPGEERCRFLITPSTILSRFKALAAEEERQARVQAETRERAKAVQERTRREDEMTFLPRAVEDVLVSEPVAEAPPPVPDRIALMPELTPTPRPQAIEKRERSLRPPQEPKPAPPLPPEPPSLAFAYRVLEANALVVLGGRKKIWRPATYISILCHVPIGVAQESVRQLVAASCLIETKNSHQNRPEFFLLGPPP
jgi:hypothetical protein